MSVSYPQKYFTGDMKIDHKLHFLPSSFSEILIAAYLKETKYMVKLTERNDQYRLLIVRQVCILVMQRF